MAFEPSRVIELLMKAGTIKADEFSEAAIKIAKAQYGQSLFAPIILDGTELNIAVGILHEWPRSLLNRLTDSLFYLEKAYKSRFWLIKRYWVKRAIESWSGPEKNTEQSVKGS